MDSTSPRNRGVIGAIESLKSVAPSQRITAAARDKLNRRCTNDETRRDKERGNERTGERAKGEGGGGEILVNHPKGTKEKQEVVMEEDGG